MTDPVTIPRRLGRVPAFDGIRGIAVLLVVWSHVGLIRVLPHSWKLSGGFLGVDVFFVLSGFLITALTLREQIDRVRVHFLAFYRRRALRLLPVIVAFGVAHYVFTRDLRLPISTEHSSLLAMAFYYMDWKAVWAPPISVAIGQLWSLAVEEQFYLVWPIVIAAPQRSGACTRTVVLVLVPAIVVVAARQRNSLRSRCVDRSIAHRNRHARRYLADRRAVGAPLGAWRGAEARSAGRSLDLVCLSGVLRPSVHARQRLPLRRRLHTDRDGGGSDTPRNFTDTNWAGARALAAPSDARRRTCVIRPVPMASPRVLLGLVGDETLGPCSAVGGGRRRDDRRYLHLVEADRAAVPALEASARASLTGNEYRQRRSTPAPRHDWPRRRWTRALQVTRQFERRVMVALGSIFAATEIGYACWAVFFGHAAPHRPRVSFWPDSYVDLRAPPAHRCGVSPSWRLTTARRSGPAAAEGVRLQRAGHRSRRDRGGSARVVAPGAYGLAPDAHPGGKDSDIRSVPARRVESDGPVVERSDPERDPGHLVPRGRGRDGSAGGDAGRPARTSSACSSPSPRSDSSVNTNDYVLGIVAVIAATAALATPAVRRRAVALGDRVSRGRGCQHALADHAQRWFVPLSNTVIFRVFEQPTMEHYFVACGMPHDAVALSLRQAKLEGRWRTEKGSRRSDRGSSTTVVRPT